MSKNLRQAINTIQTQKKIGGNYQASLAIAARAVLNINNDVAIDPDDILGTIGTALKVVTPVTPLTAFSLAFNTAGKSETMYLTPAGTLATGTITFPSDANSKIGQVLRIVSTQTQTALTVSSSGLTLVGTAVTALTANTPVSWEKVAASTWLRLN